MPPSCCINHKARLFRRLSDNDRCYKPLRPSRMDKPHRVGDILRDTYANHFTLSLSLSLSLSGNAPFRPGYWQYCIPLCSEFLRAPLQNYSRRGRVDSIRGYFVGIKSRSEKLENERKRERERERERESSHTALYNVLERIYISCDTRINMRAYNPASIPRRGRANQITAK